MTDQKAQPAQAPAFRTNRLEAFSDGVFAIAITLLVLEIAVPAGAEDDLLGAVLHEWPSYLAYLVSFSTVGAVWIGHAVITEFLERATPLLIRLNLVLLYAVREGLIRSDISDKAVKTITKRLTPGLAGYLIMILLGLFLPLLAVIGYLIIAVYNMVPIRDLRRPKAAA